MGRRDLVSACKGLNVKESPASLRFIIHEYALRLLDDISHLYTETMPHSTVPGESAPQGRAAKRIDLLLNTAAELLEEVDIHTITTSQVAERSNSAVGGVYRYFTDIESLLEALAQRLLSKYYQRLFTELPRTDSFSLETVDQAFGIYLDFCRNEPGFKALLLFGINNKVFLASRFPSGTQLADDFGAMVSQFFSLQEHTELAFDLEIALYSSTALIQHAFWLDPQGDERFIQAAIDTMKDRLRKYSRPS